MRLFRLGVVVDVGRIMRTLEHTRVVSDLSKPHRVMPRADDQLDEQLGIVGAQRSCGHVSSFRVTSECRLFDKG